MYCYVILFYMCVWELALLGFKLNRCSRCCPEDGGRPPKHVGGKIVFLYVYDLCVQIVCF